MESFKANQEKLPNKKHTEIVTLPMNEQDKRFVGSRLMEAANHLQAYAEPDNTAVILQKTTLLEQLPDGFDSIEPSRIGIEMQYKEAKNGKLGAELILNGDRATLHTDPSGEIPGVWSIHRSSGEPDILLSHDELLFDKLSNYLPPSKRLESLLDQPTITDSDMLRILTESLVSAGAKRETHTKYCTSDFMLQGGLDEEDPFFDTTIGSEIVISDYGNAVRYSSATRQSFEIAQFTPGEDVSDAPIGTVDSVYRFGIFAKKYGGAKVDARMLLESENLPAHTIKNMATEARIVGVPRDVFTHTIENVTKSHHQRGSHHSTEE